MADFQRGHKRYGGPNGRETWFVRKDGLAVNLMVHVYQGATAEKLLEIHDRYPTSDSDMLTYALIDGGCWMFADLGFHWKDKVADWQVAMEECMFWGDGPCYYDGTSLGAMQIGKRWADARYDPEWLYTHLEEVWKGAHQDERSTSDA